MAIADWNTPFTGVASAVSFKTVRDSMLELGAAAIVERYSTLGGVSPTAQGSEVVMVRRDGRRLSGERLKKIAIVG